MLVFNKGISRFLGDVKIGGRKCFEWGLFIKICNIIKQKLVLIIDLGFFMQRWSASTLTLMFVPTLTCACTEILNYSIKRWQGKSDGLSLKDSLLKISRHIPLIQPFVHISTLLKLKKARDETTKALKFYKSFNPEKVNDLNREHYKAEVEKAAINYVDAKETYMKEMTDFQELKLYEAFGESAPQAILQFAVVLQLGYMSPIHIVTIITSLFSFSMASAEVFLMMKTKNHVIKDCTWKETFLLVIPAMFLLVAPRILSMSLIVAYTKEFFILFVFIIVFVNIVLNIPFFKRDPAQVLLGTLTNVFAPCIVIDEGSAFYKRSATIASLLHVMCLVILNCLIIGKAITPCLDLERKSYPPVLHCYPGNYNHGINS